MEAAQPTTLGRAEEQDEQELRSTTPAFTTGPERLGVPPKELAHRPDSRSPRRLASLAGPRRRTIRPAERDFLVDAVMLALGVLAEFLTRPVARVPVEGIGWLVALPLLTLALLAWRGVYARRSGLRFLDDVRTVVAATAVAAMALTFFRVIVGDDPWAASQTVREWLFAAIYLTAGRGAVHIVDLKLRSRGSGGHPTLIVGAGKIGHLLARRLVERPGIGLRPVGFVDDEPLETQETPGCPVLGSVSDLEAVVTEFGVEHAILSFSRASHEEALTISRQLQLLGVAVSVVPRLFEDIPDRMTLDRIGGFPLLSIHPSNPRGWQFRVKYALDRIIATVAIVLLLPILIAVALAVFATMGRPIFFRQRRVGLDGRDFDMLKFRTMIGTPEAEGEADAAWAAGITGNDNGHGAFAPHGNGNGALDRNGNGAIPANGDGARDRSETEAGRRTTRLGSLLRRASLDELPQVFNVLRGEMSFVGPRPERRSYVNLFEDAVRRYGDRHRVKAGITGWAQVHGLRGETSLSDRVDWDNYYIENWSLWLDFKILLLTVLAIFTDHTTQSG